MSINYLLTISTKTMHW